MADQTPKLGTLAVSLFRDVAGDSAHLIRMRWLLGAGVCVGTYLCPRLTDAALPEGRLYGVGLAILLYNGVLVWLMRRTRTPDQTLRQARIRGTVWLQVLLDGLAIATLAHLTGGIHSPAIPLLFVNPLTAAVLLPKRRYPYLGAALNLGLLALVTAAEWHGVLPHHSVIPALPPDLYHNATFVAAQLGFFTVATVALVYVITTVTARLHERMRQYDFLLTVMQRTAATQDLTVLLALLAQYAHDMLAARGAVIYRLNEQDGSIVVAASSGLSPDYLGKQDIPIKRRVLDNQMLTDEPLVIYHVETDSRVWRPETTLAEGIHSLLSVPIVTLNDPLGALCVFCYKPAHFGERDVMLAQAIAAQAAAVIDYARTCERLQSADQARTQFVRTVTHELRSPVGGAQTLLRTLLKGLSGDLTEGQRDIMTRLEGRLDHLMLLINDLLEFAASRTVDLEEPLKRVLVKDVLQHVAERLSPEADTKGVTLSLDLPFEAVSVRATEEGLGRVLNNLIGNAIKYTPSGGKVQVRVVQHETQVLIAIADTGIGIPKDDLPHLWENFFRAKNAKQSKIMGTGLGLSIVKQLVDRFGGRINIQSTEGEGTTFKVMLQRGSPADDV